MKKIKEGEAFVGAYMDLAEKIAFLEKGEKGYSFSSYNSAIATVLEVAEHGSNVIGFLDRNGEAYRIFENVRRRTAGLSFTYLDTISEEMLRKAVTEKTVLVWVESIKTPFLEIPDLEMIGNICKEKNIVSVCDNSNATPHVVQPLKFGIDIVVNDSRCFLGGLEGLDLGFAVVAPDREFLQDKLGFLKNTLGSYPGRQESDFVCNALETFTERMEKLCLTAVELAAFLTSNRKVEQVYHLSLYDHPNHSFSKKLTRKTGSTLSLQLGEDTECSFSFRKRLKVFKRRENKFTMGSTFWHPASEIYSSVPAEIRRELGVSEGLFQLQVGLENTHALIDDLDQALS